MQDDRPSKNESGLKWNMHVSTCAYICLLTDIPYILKIHIIRRKIQFFFTFKWLVKHCAHHAPNLHGTCMYGTFKGSNRINYHTLRSVIFQLGLHKIRQIIWLIAHFQLLCLSLLLLLRIHTFWKEFEIYDHLKQSTKKKKTHDKNHTRFLVVNLKPAVANRIKILL